MTIDRDELKKLLPRLIREDDEIRGAIVAALGAVMPTREDLERVIQELHRESEKTRQEVDKRFEAMDKRFEAMQAQMNERFEAMDKRFEALQAQMNERFEAVDKRFTVQDQKIDKILGTVLNIQNQMGRPFEQFARNVVSRILEGEGFHLVKLPKTHLHDPECTVTPGNEDIEIDGLSDDPPVIMEVTAVLQDKEKVSLFLRKKEFVEARRNRPYRGFFLASGTELTREEIAEVTVELHAAGSELINL